MTRKEFAEALIKTNGNCSSDIFDCDDCPFEYFSKDYLCPDYYVIYEWALGYLVHYAECQKDREEFIKCQKK